MSNTALDFLNAIFADKPASHNILIWELNRQLDSKSNNFFTDIEKAAQFAGRTKPEGTDTYFCVSTLPKLRKGRGKLPDVLGIGAIHLDIDIIHPDSRVHKKNNLPANIDEAIAFANRFTLKPSIILHSGYGLHVYWLLKQFISFDDEDTRQAATKLVEDWQKMFKWAAGTLGYDVDATQDLTRVLRVPNTLNWKLPEASIEAKLLSVNTDLRYTPAQLNECMDTVRAANQVTAIIPAKNGKSSDKISLVPFNEISLEIDQNADIDATTFQALSDNIPKFKATYNRVRKDLQDTSSSTYDISLANMAIGAGLADQQVCNLLIAHRRKHGDPKLRLDYYQRTIAEAKNVTRVERQRNIAANRKSDPTDKQALKDDIYDLLGIRIERIDMLMSDPPNFIIYFEGGKYKNFGDGKGLLDQANFRLHVFNTIRKVVRKIKEPLYESAAQKMADLADEIEVSEESTEVGDVREIINTYISEHLVIDITDKEHRNNAARHAPAVLNGKLCINALELWTFAKRRYGYRKEKKDLISMLKRLKSDREVFNVKDDREKQHSVSVYVLPAEWLPVGAVRTTANETEDFHYAGMGK